MSPQNISLRKYLLISTFLSLSSFAQSPAPFKTSSTTKSRSRAGESESTDGYIIQHTDKGILKIPRKQSFKFGGSDVDGQAQAPSQSVFGKRPSPQRASLIPERTSFKNEVLDTVGSP